jgi:chitinase
VTSVTQTSVTFGWTASSDNVGVTGYGLYLGGSAAGSATGLSGTISGLSCGTTYTVGVDAHDAAGNHSSVSSTSVTTAACAPPPPPPPPPPGDTQAPSVPAGLAGSVVSRTAVSLAWNPSNDNVGVTGYDVSLNGSTVTTTGAVASSWKFTGLVCGTTYTLGVDAFDAAGNHSAVATTTATTKACAASTIDSQPPSAPTGVSASAASKTALNVAWSASTDNVGVTGYEIYLNGALVKTSGPSWSTARLTLLACGTTYSVGVDAFDAAGNRSPVVSVSGATSPCKAAINA